MSLRADARLLRLAIEKGLIGWDDLEAVPQPEGPAPAGSPWGPWITALIAARHLDEARLLDLVQKLDPTTQEVEVELPEGKRPPVPANWNRYQILGFLGSGGMGSVYKGFDPSLKRFVALKFLSRDRRSGHDLLSEARAQAKVEHPNVCQVYEVGAVGDRSYIAMQYIEGRPIDRGLADFPDDTKVSLVHQVAQAVHAAHRMGLVHRDLKPGNILVTTGPSGTLRCFVVDFGLAEEQHKVTSDGDRLAGTPAYLSPEQITGGPIDRRTDVYSLGVLLHKLLTGTVPFRDPDLLRMLNRITDEEATPPGKLRKGLSRDLETIILKCLEKDPERRYSSARSLAEDLQRYLDGEPIEARRQSWTYRVGKRLRKNRLAAALAVVAVVALALSGVASVRGRLEARRQAELAQRFGQQVKEMEASMRYAAFLPPSNAARYRDELRRRMGELELEMNRIGDVAVGPGCYALGRSHLALHDYEAAREYLERAFSAGYRTPELARDLGTVMTMLGQKATSSDGAPRSSLAVAADREELDRVYRRPAQALLKAGAEEAVTSSYHRALIALAEGGYREALVAADAAYQESPWLYEARALAASVHEAMARDATDEGRYADAVAEYDTAGAIYAEVLDVVRSDAWLYVAECSRRVHRNHVVSETGELTETMVMAAAEPCRKALEIDPDFAEAYTAQAANLWQWADEQRKQGQDPRPMLEQSVRLAGEALQRNRHDYQAHRHITVANRILASWEISRGEDPVPALERAIAAAQAAIEIQPDLTFGHNSLGNAYLTLARYRQSRGEAPLESLDRAAASYADAIERNPRYLPGLINLSTVWKTRSEWEIDHGRDPAESLAKALAPLEQGLAMNRNSAQLHNNLGNVHLTQGEYELARGIDPREALARAVESYRRTVEVNPNYGFAYYNLGYAERLRGEYLGEVGEDPAAAVAAAYRALDEAEKRNPMDADNLLERARVSLLAARWAAAHDGAPERLFEAADEQVERGLVLNAANPLLLQVGADVCSHRAAWLLDRRRGAGDVVDRGLDRIDRALELNPDLTEGMAIRGVLLRLAAAGETDRERRGQLTAEALADLEQAIEANPLLRRTYSATLDELRAAAAGSN